MNDIAFVIAGVLLGMLGLLLNDVLRQRRQRRAQEASELARHIERRRAEADRLRRRQDTQSAAKPQAPKARPVQAPKAQAEAKAKPAAPAQAAPQANAAPALLPGGLRGNNMFGGEIVAFTGTIPGMTRREAMQAVEANGGKVQHHARRRNAAGGGREARQREAGAGRTPLRPGAQDRCRALQIHAGTRLNC